MQNSRKGRGVVGWMGITLIFAFIVSYAIPRLVEAPPPLEDTSPPRTYEHVDVFTGYSTITYRDEGEWRTARLVETLKEFGIQPDDDLVQAILESVGILRSQERQDLANRAHQLTIKLAAPEGPVYADQPDGEQYEEGLLNRDDLIASDRNRLTAALREVQELSSLMGKETCDFDFLPVSGLEDVVTRAEALVTDIETHLPVTR